MSFAHNKRAVFACQCSSTVFCTPRQAKTLLCEGKGRTLMLLIRHGATDWNMQARLQGREEIPLNGEGTEQAHALAEKIAEIMCKDGAVFTSPLSRAQNTAECIAKAAELGEPVVTDGLIERDYGSITGMTFAERRRIYKVSGEFPDDIETVDDATLRMKRTLGQIRKMTAKKTVAVVTHGGVINALLSCITCGRAGCNGNIAANCAVSPVAVGNKDIIPLAFNLTKDEICQYVSEIMKLMEC